MPLSSLSGEMTEIPAPLDVIMSEKSWGFVRPTVRLKVAGYVCGHLKQHLEAVASMKQNQRLMSSWFGDNFEAELPVSNMTSLPKKKSVNFW